MKLTGVLQIAVAMASMQWMTLSSVAVADDVALEEIVVTAQKRAEDVYKVPISISVFDRSAMEKLNIEDMADVAAVSPGVDYQNVGGVNRLTVRGITTGTAQTGYSTTGLYIDDIPIQVRPSSQIALYGSTVPMVFDLDRVEVLRGPQGTLFGAGAEGGAIRFITPQPSLTDYSGYARAGAATTDGGAPSYETGAAFGGPIVSDELGFRVSAWHRVDGGYIQYDSPLGSYKDPNGNWQESTVVRAAMTYAPTQSLKITPSVYYQDVYINNIGSFEPAESASAANDFFVTQYSGLNPQYTNVRAGYFVNPQDIQTPSDDVFTLPALKVVYDVGPVELASNTGYLHRLGSNVQDFTAFVEEFSGIPGWVKSPAAAAAGDRNVIYTNQNVLTQEVHLQSVDAASPLQWTVGAFYTQARQGVLNEEESPYLPTLIFDYFGETMAQLGKNPNVYGDLSYYGTEQTVDEQTALFGQASYRITDHWSLTAGIRGARESNKYSIYFTGRPGAHAFSGEESEHVVDPKFGINYQLDDKNLLYFTAAKGDRIGGVNSPFSTGDTGCIQQLNSLGVGESPTTYRPDSLWSFEIGSKNRLFDNRLNIEASVFHIVWNNVQEAVSVPACGGDSFTANLGKATSNGFDLQTIGVITDSFHVGLNLGYTNAKQSNTVDIGGDLAAVAGSQLNPYGSPWLVSPNVEYTFDLEGGHKAYIRVDDTYHSRNPGPFAADNPDSVSYDGLPFFANPAYNTLNAHVGTTWDKWDLSVYALNALNAHPITYYQANTSIQPTGGAYTIRPLTIGFTAALRW
jgi:iron complex outermembrane receptor protein